MLLRKIRNEKKLQMGKDELLRYLEGQDTDILLTIGAGDIDQLVGPLKEIILSKINDKS